MRLAWGIHLGLLALIVSALLSRPSPPLERGELAVLVLVGVALIAWALLERGRHHLHPGLRALMALGAALLLDLARTPRLVEYVQADSRSQEVLQYLRVDLASVAVLVAFFFWLGYWGAGGQKWQRPAPLQRSTATALALVVGLAVACYLAFHGLYGVRGDLGTGLVIFRTLKVALLLVVVLGSSGGPLIRRAPAYYLGGGLIAVAVVLALTGAGEGALP
jgi:hypothetical protein